MQRSMPRLLVVVPGFGPGHIDLKRTILSKNLDLIRRTYTGSVDVRVFNYGDVSCGAIGVDERFQRGYVGQFLFNHITPDSIKAYDDILVILDDIELSDNIIVDEMFHNLKHYNLDIVSPALSPTSKFSHRVMLQQNTNGIRIAPFVEFFSYFMTPASYTKWWNLLNKDSAWLWGIDFALFYKGFKLGLTDTHTIHHHIKGESYSPDAPNAWNEFRNNMQRLHIPNRTADMPPLCVVPWQKLDV
jgi:hypothetical protein